MAERRPADGSASSGRAQPRIAVGVVRRPWGFDGSIAISQHSDDPGRFAPGTRVFVGESRFTVERISFSGRSTVLKLASIDTEAQAAALRGRSIEMEAEALPPPPPGAYYHYQIMGARVVTVGGEELGSVAEILETGSNDVYVVRGQKAPGQKAATEILVPALKDVLVEIDVEHGVITVDLPEGLR